jgi:hypothetical protein
MIAALFMAMSICGISGSCSIDFAAFLTDDRESKSIGTNFVRIEELILWMASIVGWILERERPSRRMVDGEPLARDIAVSAPIPPSLGPVMRKTFPLTWEGKSETMVFPSVLKPYSAILDLF